MTDPMTFATFKAGLAGWLAGLASVTVLGIPGGAFVAALVASALNNTQEVVPGRNIPQRLGRVLRHALLGGWLSLAAIHLKLFRGHGIEELGTTVTAALLTLAIPPSAVWLKANGARMAGDAWQVAVAWLHRVFGGGQ